MYVDVSSDYKNNVCLFIYLVISITNCGLKLMTLRLSHALLTELARRPKVMYIYNENK